MSRSSHPAARAGHGATVRVPEHAPTAVLLDGEADRLVELAAALAGRGIATVASETTIAAACTAARRLAPSLVVLDDGVGDGTTTTADAVARLREHQPFLKIVCLTHVERGRSLGAVFAAGADAVFLRQSSSAELARAIWRLLRDDAGFVPVPGWAPAGGSRPGTPRPPTGRSRTRGPASRPDTPAAPTFVST